MELKLQLVYIVVWKSPFHCYVDMFVSLLRYRGILICDSIFIIIIVISGATAHGLFQDFFPLEDFFLQGEVVSLTPSPQPGGPGLRIYIPRRQGCPAIPLYTR
jgi:hypothetical protein